MEPRARLGKSRGQQTFTDQELQLLLYSHGDVPHPLPSTRRILDEALTDFVVNLAFETSAAASMAGRQKIKVDDVKHACRRNSIYLGRIEEAFEKKNAIDRAKSLVSMDKNLTGYVGDDGKTEGRTATGRVSKVGKKYKGKDKPKTGKIRPQTDDEVGYEDDVDLDGVVDMESTLEGKSPTSGG